MPSSDDFMMGFERLGGFSREDSPVAPKPQPQTTYVSSEETYSDPRTATEKRLKRQLLAEYAARQVEALKLYRPMSHQLPVHMCNSQEILAFGSNQSGKTTTAAVELAWIVTNQHPYKQFPKSGIAFVVGRDNDHIAHTIMPKLLKPIPSLRRIRDLETHKWRQYDPRGDVSRFDESVPMGPLIPERMIENIAWENRGQGIPAKIVMKNGWEIHFFTAKGSPPQGATIDYLWLDEEVSDEWYIEGSARLMAKKGRFFWSATPQVGGMALVQLHDRCQSQLAWPEESRSSSEFFMLLGDNLHIDDSEKAKLAEKFKHDPDAYRVRILGQFLILGGLIYPQWSNSRHVIEAFPVPDTWTRYIVVDPGHTVCAVLKFAVPPPSDPVYGGCVYCIDELYMRECDPTVFGNAMKHFTDGEIIQAMIIDDCGSRRVDGAVGINMRQAYSKALADRKIKSVETGSDFYTGISDVKPGLMQVRQWIGEIVHHGENGDCPKLQVFNTCSNLISEIRVYYKKRHPKFGWTDEPNQVNNHCCDCLRYAAMHGCRYVAPRRKPNSLWRRWFESEQKANRGDGFGVNLCAGSGNK